MTVANQSPSAGEEREQRQRHGCGRREGARAYALHYARESRPDNNNNNQNGIITDSNNSNINSNNSNNHHINKTNDTLIFFVGGRRSAAEGRGALAEENARARACLAALRSMIRSSTITMLY